MAAEQNFSQILDSLLSIDNAIRQSAEVSETISVNEEKIRTHSLGVRCEREKKTTPSVINRTRNHNDRGRKKCSKKCPQCAVN